jgi:hypothetical protein
MKYPKTWKLEHLVRHISSNSVSVQIGDKWVPARPCGFCSFRSRLRAAWLVYTGRADAVEWPEDAA